MIARRTGSLTVGMRSWTVGGEGVVRSSSEVGVIRGVSVVIVIMDIGRGTVPVTWTITCCRDCGRATICKSSSREAIVISSLVVVSVAGRASKGGCSEITSLEFEAIIEDVWSGGTRGSCGNDSVDGGGRASGQI